VEWLKVKTLSSNPSTAKTKQKTRKKNLPFSNRSNIFDYERGINKSKTFYGEVQMVLEHG
jgi:hypothetical protein